jgi:hypothetical protein
VGNADIDVSVKVVVTVAVVVMLMLDVKLDSQAMQNNGHKKSIQDSWSLRVIFGLTKGELTQAFGKETRYLFEKLEFIEFAFYSLQVHMNKSIQLKEFKFQSF